MPEPRLDRWAHLYDRIYAVRGKRYDIEADRIWRIVTQTAGHVDALLDVACGTGEHLKYMRRRLPAIVGVDQCPAMLAVARSKLPGIRFVESDMRTMALGRRFDVVTCLFGSIGYLPDSDALRLAVDRMARHLSPNGTLLVEPSLFLDRLQPPSRHRLVTDQDDCRVERVTTAQHRDGRLVIRFDFTIRNHGATETFADEHSIGLFEQSVYEEAFDATGLRIHFDPIGLAGNGLYIAR